MILITASHIFYAAQLQENLKETVLCEMIIYSKQGLS